MKYMKLYGSMAGDQHAEVARLLRRIERYRRALRRCARRRKREREAGATLREPAATVCCEETIPQLETGSSDPRLSTIVEIARSLRIAPIVLLCGPDEVRGLAALENQPADGRLAVAADVFSATLPGAGTVVGAELAKLLDPSRRT